MVSIQNGWCTPIPFTQMEDPVSGRVKVRMVDSTAQSCQIARQYMIRLSDEDPKIRWYWAAARPWRSCRRRHFNAGFSLSVRT